MAVEERSLHLEVHREDGFFWAQVTEWPGCLASGESLEELMEAVEEAISLSITAGDQPLVPVRLRIDGIELRVGSEALLRVQREDAAAGPLRTPPVSKTPHWEWGYHRFHRRPHD
jgi:predicted RNase H-like HicB family nuclease